MAAIDWRIRLDGIGKVRYLEGARRDTEARPDGRQDTMHALETIAGLEAQDAAREDAELAASAWKRAVAEAKRLKAALKGAEDAVKAQHAVLKATLKPGDTVTVDGNSRYTFVDTTTTRLVDSKVLAALAVKYPHLRDEIEDLKADPANRSKPYEQPSRALKALPARP